MPSYRRPVTGLTELSRKLALVPAHGLVSADEVGVRVDDSVLLAPVSLDVDAAQALAVTGANGSGKTTLLRTLAGLTRPTTGTVRVAGAPADERQPEFRARVAAQIGMAPVADNLTLREHLVLVGASWGFSVAEAENRADGLLDDFGIARLANRFRHELSSGQARLFTLALTLSRPFEVLVVDEPEQRLDADRLDLVGTVLRRLVDAGTALVLASHSTTLIHHVADRVLHLTSDVDGQHD